jgi:hypothetical protein
MSDLWGKWQHRGCLQERYGRKRELIKEIPRVNSVKDYASNLFTFTERMTNVLGDTSGLDAYGAEYVGANVFYITCGPLFSQFSWRRWLIDLSVGRYDFLLTSHLRYIEE